MQSRWDWERRVHQSWPVKAWCSSAFFNASSAATVALDAAWGDEIFAQDLTALDDAPAGRFQGGIDVLGSGLGFVHGKELCRIFQSQTFRLLSHSVNGCEHQNALLCLSKTSFNW
jgi:hypothetical protein